MRSYIGRFGNEMNTLLQLGLFLTDLLHLKHPLHNQLIFTLLVGMALVFAFPWEVELGLATFIKRDQQVSALISVRNWNPSLDHLSLGGYHLLGGALKFHD